jgi:hypothetical protein
MGLKKIGIISAMLVILAGLSAVAQERFGGLVGVVTDTSKAAVPGATVTVTSKQSGAMRTVVTGSDGAYRVPDLTPGRYTVVVELSGFQKANFDDVLVILGREFPVNAELQPGAVTEVVNVTGTEKQIDLKSVTLSHNVNSEELDRLPKARSFQGIALTAPGVNQGDIEGGFQVNGASGAENSFTVDGISTNSILYGSSRQNTVFEYVQEVQVKTSGIDAQYGGALGGVISAVTKSGGNIFHGEGHYFFSGNKLSAGPVPRLQLSPVDDTSVFTPQDPKQSNNLNEVGGSIGGPIVKDRLFFFGSASPRFQRRTNDYLFSNGTEPGSIDLKNTYTQLFGKLTYSSSRIQANASILATPTRVTGTLPAYNGTGALVLSSTFASNAVNINRGFQQDQYNASGDVDIWLGTSNYITVRGGYFYDNYNDTGIPNTTSVLWNTSSIPTALCPACASLPASLQQPQNFQNTPRAQITQFDTAKVGLFQIDYNHSFSAGGSHLLKGGFGIRRAQNDVNLAYPGGYVLINWGRSFTSTVPGVGSGTGTYGYYEVDDRGTKGLVTANMPSLYVQDAWTIANRLTVNLGIRTEREIIPSFRPNIQEKGFEFGFGDKLAPRLGASYDVMGDGRMKVFGSWGRYFDWVKYELARGSFGGDVWNIYYHALDTTDVFNLGLGNMPGRNLWNPVEACNTQAACTTAYRDRRVPNFGTVDPNIKPMSQDSTNVGFEYQVNSTTVFNATYVHNNLRRTIEDIGSLDANGNEVYFEANPGEGIATTMFSTGLQPKIQTPKPIRKYDALELTLSRRFSKNWFGNVNVTISRLYGNYSGLANSDEITTPTTGVSSATAQQQTGSIARPGTSAGRAWDLDELEFDSHGNLDVVGRLATDRPVVAKFYGAYNFPFGTQIGFFEYVGSGTPMSTVVNTVNQIPVFVNGRGDMGRTPVLSHTDLLLSHEFKAMRNNKVRLELNVINIFNQKTATHIFNNLNKGAGLARGDSAIDLSGTDLRQGYDYRALILASQSGVNAFDPRYGKPDLWQTGAQGQFSVKFVF